MVQSCSHWAPSGSTDMFSSTVLTTFSDCWMKQCAANININSSLSRLDLVRPMSMNIKRLCWLSHTLLLHHSNDSDKEPIDYVSDKSEVLNFSNSQLKLTGNCDKRNWNKCKSKFDWLSFDHVMPFNWALYCFPMSFIELQSWKLRRGE